MDQRHEQIREGAGLEESRINTEFVDLIKKWSTPVLFVAAAISMGYLGLIKLEDRRVARIDQAFSELELQRNSQSPSPDSLLRVADDYSDIRAVAPLARLAAADIYFNAVVIGIEPGAPLTSAGAPESESDRLTDDSREAYLGKAGRIYAEVADKNDGVSGREVIVIDALYGVASVAEMEHDKDGAVGAYRRLEELADRVGFPVHAGIARARIDSIDQAIVEIALLNDADQPRAPIPGVLSGSLPGSVDAITIPPKPVEIVPAPVQGPAPEDVPVSDEPVSDEPPADPGQ